MTNIFKNEPAVIVAAVVAVIQAGIAFGLDVTAEQLAAITTALLGVLGLVIRSQVTPTASLVVPEDIDLVDVPEDHNF